MSGRVSGRRQRWRVDPAEGREPDYRFTLANERTFLAWNRTALGLLAGGVAARELIDSLGRTWVRTALALAAIAASVVLSVGGYLRWVAVQRAVRREQPLPPARLVPVVSVVVFALAAVAFVLVALE